MGIFMGYVSLPEGISSNLRLSLNLSKGNVFLKDSKARGMVSKHWGRISAFSNVKKDVV